MKKWREQATEILAKYQPMTADQVAKAFPNTKVTKGETKDWTVVTTEYQGVPLTIHIYADGDFWFQLPPFLSASGSKSFDQQKEIFLRVKEDFDPIRTNAKKEDGVTNIYLVGAYFDPILGTWDADEEGILWLPCEDRASAEELVAEYAHYIPKDKISIQQGEEESGEISWFISIPAQYKAALVKADSPYNPNQMGLVQDIPGMPFTSSEGLIVSPSADIVKAWVDLFLFLQKEFS